MIKNIFLLLGLISIVGTTDAMHVSKATKLSRAPKIKTPAKKPKQQPRAQVRHARKDEGKFPAIPDNKKPAQVAPVIREARVQQTKEQIKTQAANTVHVIRELQEQRIKFVELCKLEDEKAHEVAREYYIRYRWKHLEYTQLQEAFIDLEVKNPKVLLMLLRTLASELRVIKQAFERDPMYHRSFTPYLKDFGILLQEKFMQAVQADDINLVYFLLFKLKLDEEQPGSLINPETIKNSGIDNWVYKPFFNMKMEQETSDKLSAILKQVELQELELLDHGQDAMTQALRNLFLFVDKA